MKDERFANPKVREALRYLIDYQGINAAIMPYYGQEHQRPISTGFLGELPDPGYTLDVEKAKALLAEAGYPDGFKVTPPGAGRRAVHERRDRDPGDAGAGRASRRRSSPARASRSTARCASGTSSSWSAAAAAGSCRTRTRTCGRWSTTPTTATRPSSPTSRAGGPRSSIPSSTPQIDAALVEADPAKQEADVRGDPGADRRGGAVDPALLRGARTRSPTAPTSRASR